MKAMLLRVGIDKGTDGFLGPIFKDGTFTFVPISKDTRRYPPNKNDKRYSDLFSDEDGNLPKFLPPKMANKYAHNDPEFVTFTYGDDTRKRDYFHKLSGDDGMEPGDFLVFYAGLTPYEVPDQKEGLYIVGYFEVEEVVDFRKNIPEPELRRYEEAFKNNPHVPIRNERPIIVKGKEGKGGLLHKAILISEDGLDKNAKRLLIASKEMVSWLEPLGPRSSLQRSIPPRFVRSEYVEQFMDRLRNGRPLSPGPDT
jgi:hypothetical protein